jgi:hypothetical protein
VEDIGPPTTAIPDGGAARDRDGFGTLALRPWGGDFTSFSVGGKIVSSLGFDFRASPDGQDGGGPAPFDYYELNADYSSSTLEGGLFPAAVTDFGSVDSLILNGQTLFGDNDHADGFSVNRFGPWSLGPSNLDPFVKDPTPRKGSGQCSSDGPSASVISCDTEENLTTSPGAGSEAGYQPAPQSPNLPGASAPAGGASLSTFEMMAAQNSFATAWPWDVIKETFPPACCDVAPPIVDGANAPASDFANPGGSLNSDQPPNFNPPPDPTGGVSITNIGAQPPSVPEIPPPAMLLIGFAGLALLGSRRLRGSARLG